MKSRSQSLTFILGSSVRSHGLIIQKNDVHTSNGLKDITYLDTTEHLSPFGLSSGSIIVSTLFSDFRCQKFSIRIQLKSFNVAII